MENKKNNIIDEIINCTDKDLKVYVEIWKARSNDAFAKVIREIIAETDSYYKKEMQRTTNPIDHFLAIYCLDGDKRTTYKKLVRFLYDEFRDVNDKLLNLVIDLESFL